MGKDISVVVNRECFFSAFSFSLCDPNQRWGDPPIQVPVEIHTRNIESVQDDWEKQLCGTLRARLYFFWRRVSSGIVTNPSLLLKLGILK